MTTTTRAPKTRLVALETIRESPFNRRRTWGDLEGLAASLKSPAGQLQPALGRMVAGDLVELVFGHRRFRAAQLGGLSHLVVDVRELSDAQARELIAVENVQRTDIHPLDEAELYQAMHEQDGLDVAELGAKLGRSRGYVYGRLALGRLVDEAKILLALGALSLGGAMVLTRLPAEQQRLAIEQFKDRASADDPLSASEVQRLVQWKVTLRLADSQAPTDRADLPGGSCQACPKNTSVQRGLFGDVDLDDGLCTDRTCFDARKKAFTDELLKAAKDSGATVLTKNEAKALWPNSWESKLGKLVELNRPDPRDPQHKPLADRLEKAPLEVEKVVAVHPHSGLVVELAPRAQVNRALTAQYKWATKPAEGAAPKRALPVVPSTDVDDDLHDRAITALVAVVEKERPTPALWLELLTIPPYPHEALARRRKDKKATPLFGEQLKAALQGMTGAQLQGLLWESLMQDLLYDRKRLEAACKARGVDWKALTAPKPEAAKVAKVEDKKAKASQKKGSGKAS